ncbi:Rhodanese-like domain-containing protein [Tuber brumale]|nr:Rhodanese-like domain-containing protein [Tuber brumale]
MSAPEQQPWHAAYPKPISEAVFLPRSTVLEWFSSNDKLPGKHFVLVDLRRNDHEGGTIKTSINLPAQSMHPSIPALYTLFSSAGVSAIVFYCGSSQGRGSRAASWMQDYINEKGDNGMKSFALEGGIKGWVKEGGKLLEMIDEYAEEAWKEPAKKE